MPFTGESGGWEKRDPEVDGVSPNRRVLGHEWGPHRAEGCRRPSGRLMGAHGGGSPASPRTFLLRVPARHTHVVARPRVGPSLTSAATSNHSLCLPHRTEGCWGPVAEPRSQGEGVCVNLGQRCRPAPTESPSDWPERLHVIAAFHPLRRLGFARFCRNKTNRRITRL